MKNTKFWRRKRNKIKDGLVFRRGWASSFGIYFHWKKVRNMVRLIPAERDRNGVFNNLLRELNLGDREYFFKKFPLFSFIKFHLSNFLRSKIWVEFYINCTCKFSFITISYLFLGICECPLIDLNICII